jgi:hypothetical protein
MEHTEDRWKLSYNEEWKVNWPASCLVWEMKPETEDVVKFCLVRAITYDRSWWQMSVDQWWYGGMIIHKGNLKELGE